jgi:hypothetical protein
VKNTKNKEMKDKIKTEKLKGIWNVERIKI